MFKSISNLGTVLTKSKQQTIQGGVTNRMPEPCPDGSPRVYHPITGWMCIASGKDIMF